MQIRSSKVIVLSKKKCKNDYLKHRLININNSRVYLIINLKQKLIKKQMYPKTNLSQVAFKKVSKKKVSKKYNLVNKIQIQEL